MANEFAGSPVRLEGITKRFGKFVAVDNVSIDVDGGEFVTLLGASGSGKTTLLRMIAGFLQPDAGRIIIAGKDLTDLPVHKRKIGMVFQNYALFPHMTVYQNVMFPVARQKFPQADRDGMVREALAAVELESFATRKPTELSGGQQQRVALARAIVTRPRVLLMDEPLGALDRRLREALQIEIRRLSSDLGITVINVTHDQDEALTMSDRIALLETGKLVQFDSPTVMFENPNSKISASFLGESNMFDGEVTMGSDGPRIELGEGTIHVPTGAGVTPVGAGEQCLVMIRPSRVRIGAASTPPVAGQSFVRGRIRSVIYAGEYRKVFLTREGGSELIARLSANDSFDLTIGDEAIAYWDPQHSTVVESSHDTSVKLPAALAN